jgi:hypothetical protein
MLFMTEAAQQPELLAISWAQETSSFVNTSAPNNIYICRTAQLPSRRCILNIYLTNIPTEYFKHAAHSPFFPLPDAVYFIIISFLVPVIFTF